MQKTYKLAELFSGPGGLALGAKWASFSNSIDRLSIEPVWAIDNDEDACNTYRRNVHSELGYKEAEQAVVCDDVREFFKSHDRLPEFDALAFGFPCNDFSIVGEQLGFGGTYGPLYSYGVRAIELRSPSWFLAENVGGIRTANEGKAFRKVLKDLVCAGPGYTITAHLYRFEEYSVPQARHRVIIVGIRRDLGVEYGVPCPLTPKPSEQTSAARAIEYPPILRDDNNNELTSQSRGVVERLQMLPPGENAWQIDRLLGMTDVELVDYYERFPQPKEQAKGVDFTHAASIRSRLRKVRLNVKSARMSQIYRRLLPHRPSYTITGSGGGGTHGYHWREARALTNRERARLQTFPDDYFFCGSKESVRRQVGMAVPPLGAKVVFRSLLKALAGMKTESCPANIGVFRRRQDIDEALATEKIKKIADQVG